jgi:hypothetical protein
MLFSMEGWKGRLFHHRSSSAGVGVRADRRRHCTGIAPLLTAVTEKTEQFCFQVLLKLELKHAELMQCDQAEIPAHSQPQGQSGYGISEWWLEESRTDKPTTRIMWSRNISLQPMAHPILHDKVLAVS